MQTTQKEEIKIAVLQINNIYDINNFVRLMGQYEAELFLRSGRYLVNAKSSLGVLSLDLTKPVTLLGYEGAITSAVVNDIREQLTNILVSGEITI